MARARKKRSARRTKKSPGTKSSPARPRPAARGKAATSRARSTARAKAKAPRATAKETKRPARRRKRSPRAPDVATPDRVPGPSAPEPGGRMLTARARTSRSSPVLAILEDRDPLGALRRFFEALRGRATPAQAQTALGAAQLLLLPLSREPRGDDDVEEIVDLVLRHWSEFGDRRTGFHAQEFLRHALRAVGVDRERITRLAACVPPDAGSDLLIALASAHAVARDKVPMLRAVNLALAAGVPAEQFRTGVDFAVYQHDPDLAVALARADIPAIPVDIAPHFAGVRAALDQLLATLKELGAPAELRPPLRLDVILDAERAGRISLPNDYRALLSLTNGMTVAGHQFFGAGDYRGATQLATRARRFLELGAAGGQTALAQCVPVASLRQPDGWLIYDPRGRLLAREPGYVLALGDERWPVRDLSEALARIEHAAREALGTN